MSNSPLVNYTKLSPNHSGQRTHSIDRITPHCVVGQLTAEGIAACFPYGRGASCNYGIGYDGRVALIVEEKNRSWCSSSEGNDQRAVTIEVASDKTHPYAFTNAAYSKLVDLCVDICKRNGIYKVLWISDKNKALNYAPQAGECVLTVHRWFANKACPGDWLYSRMGDLAKAINAKLGKQSDAPAKKPAEEKADGNLYRVQVGAYKSMTNAQAQLSKLKAKGVDAFVTSMQDGLYKVQAGAYSSKANAEAQTKKLGSLGFDAVILTSKQSSSKESFTPRKGVDEIAKEIWEGKCSGGYDSWGSGETRKKRLRAAGYDPDAVQQEINRRYG